MWKWFLVGLSWAQRELNTVLKADEAWQTHLSLELVQYISKVGDVFGFISDLKRNGMLAGETEKELYDFIWKDNFIEKHMPSSLSDNLKMSLALHEFAPAIQAYYHYYQEEVLRNEVSNCATWVELGGKQFCEPNWTQEDILNGSLTQILPFDHLYSGKKKNMAILYADIHSSIFSSFQSKLQQDVNENPDFGYLLRFKPGVETHPYSISGFGVELAVKNTEYKVVDDRSLETMDSIEKTEAKDKKIFNDKVPTVQKLTKEEIFDIAFRTVSFARSSSNNLETLLLLIKDFPKYSHLLIKEEIDSEVHDQSMKFVHSFKNYQNLYLNGLSMDIDRFNSYKFLQLMRKVKIEADHFKSMGISLLDSIHLKYSFNRNDKGRSEWGDSFNTTSDQVIWLNDLEKDAMYTRFPKSFFSALQASRPDSLIYSRENAFSIIFFIDFKNEVHVAEVAKIFQVINQQAPWRFGIVPIIYDDDELGNTSNPNILLSHVLLAVKKENPELVGRFIWTLLHHLHSNSQDISAGSILQVFSKVVGLPFDIALVNNSQLIQDLKEFRVRLGVTDSGAIFANGCYLSLEGEWINSAVQIYFSMVNHLRQAFILEEFPQGTNLYEYFLSLPGVYQTRNELIFPNSNDALKTINLLEIPNYREVLSSLTWLTSKSDTFSKLSVIIISDFEEKESLGLNAINAIKEFAADIRIVLIDVPKTPRTSPINSLFDKEKVGIEELSSALSEKGVLTDNIFDSEWLKLVKKIPKLKLGDSNIIVNGRLVGPIISFSKEDFLALFNFEMGQRASKLSKKLDSILGNKGISNRELSDICLCMSSYLISTMDTKEQSRLNIKYLDEFVDSKIYFEEGDKETSTLLIDAIVEPVSPTGQKILGLVEQLRTIPGMYVRVFAFAAHFEDTEKLPINQFYRYSMEKELKFSANGAILPSVTTIKGMPHSTLLTLGMDVPDSWLIRATDSLYDLDNINLSSIPENQNLDAEFTLKSIFVQGHASERNTNMPPRGLQFVLGTRSDPFKVDTITMANLGYLQLKSSPGVWNLRIRPGQSAKVYELVAANSGKNSRKSDNMLIVDEFSGLTVYPLVKKRPGMENESVLQGKKENGGIWNKIKTSIFGSEEEPKNRTINVFSVASGHLYERFLGIMMLSVKRHTKNPVKFWLIENFLSPSFIKFLPTLASKYDFEYELVTYKWPHWLRKQTEKQRIIWGYKILFLDVLFPLSLDKVIFVDADQVVRADLIELVEMNLDGAVYGYTPFCSDKTEMDGFRFWKGGYWEKHLHGRPYHISALYVVDLVRFREIAAGDRLRQQYHLLSADPHSLSNLDQDLPNNMIHEIPMFSLPQEWLWCETWCSDESLKKAKTIDLCNNPMTKEPKLDRARRILPEWVGYDEEIAAVRKEFFAMPIEPESETLSETNHDEL